MASVPFAAPTCADDVAFSHVTVVDVVEGRPVRDQIVRVAGERISIVARTPNDARQIVDILSRRGAEFVKAYEMLGRDALFALVEQAKKSGLPVAAHVPFAVLAGEASDAGVRSFEHLRNIEFACSREDGWSLYGLARALEAQGEEAAAVDAAFREVWRNADVEITASRL